MKKIGLTIILAMISLNISAQTRPPNLSVVSEGTFLNIFWDNVIDAEGYVFYFAPFPTGEPISTLDLGPETTSLSGDLSDGDAFFVAVSAVKDGVEGDFSNVESFTVSAIDPEDANATEGEAIANIAQTVILDNYIDLETRAIDLFDAVITLSLNTNADNLIAAQQAWRQARRAWEQTEAFLFGPVDTMGFDPALDSWPVNRQDLDAVLTSSNSLTTDFVANLDNTLKGFHTIEYLLFGDSNDKIAADVTAREKEYLVAVTDNLTMATRSLADAWRPGSGNFVAEFLNIDGGGLFPSNAAALQEIVEGMGIIADEVGNGKISDPFAEENPELVESQFSFNSLLDFADNIRGIENIYIGRFSSNDGPGLNDLVRQTNTQLDEDMRAAISQAIAEIQNIPFPFRDAISTTDGRAQIEVAIAAVNELQILIEGSLLQELVQ